MQLSPRYFGKQLNIIAMQCTKNLFVNRYLYCSFMGCSEKAGIQSVKDMTYIFYCRSAKMQNTLSVKGNTKKVLQISWPQIFLLVAH